MNGFDIDVFNALIDYVVIGGYDSKGKKDPYMLRFICKTKAGLATDEEALKEMIVANNQLNDEHLSNAMTILGFISNQMFVTFDIERSGQRKRRVIQGIRVRLEVDCQL